MPDRKVTLEFNDKVVRQFPMELAAVNSPAAAFVAGLVTSLHCAGMCGPLACTLKPAPGDRRDAATIATVYQLSRLVGYAALGGLVRLR